VQSVHGANARSTEVEPPIGSKIRRDSASVHRANAMCAEDINV
jgi:hypothetical protein